MPNIAGNSLQTATLINLTSTVQSFPDIAAATANDYYRFNIYYRSSFNLTLTGLSDDVDVTLLDSAGNSVVVGGLEQRSANTGRLAEMLNATLDIGTYYIRVAPASGVDSADYTLGVSAQSNLQPNLFWRNPSGGINNIWQFNGTQYANSLSLPRSNDPNWRVAALGDFNQDGQTDLFWRYVPDGRNLIWFLNGATVLSSTTVNTVRPGWSVEAVADFNGDGSVDLFWRNANGQNVVWAMNGAQSLSSLPFVARPDVDWQVQGAGDFNRDGRADLLWRNEQTGRTEIWLLNGTSVQSSTEVRSRVSTSWQIVGIGDYNQDGNDDIVWRNTSGSNSIWLMRGNRYIGSAAVPSASPGWEAIGSIITTNPPTRIDGVGNTLSNALNLGQGLSGNAIYRAAVGGLANSSDVYRIQVDANSRVSLSLGELGDNLDLVLLDSRGGVVANSTQGSLDPESIVRTLTAGTYYIQVLPGTPTAVGTYALGISINNLPSLVTNNRLTIAEGDSRNLDATFLQVTDLDSPQTGVIYTLGDLPDNGSLVLNGTTLSLGGTFSQADLNDGTRLRYVQNGSETTSDSFTFTVADAAGVILPASTFNIAITPVNDQPVLTVPASISVDQNSNASIAGIRITDPDAGTGEITVSLSATNGVLTLGFTNGLRFNQGDGVEDRSLIFRGTLEAVNRALSLLVYRGDASFRGQDTIALSVNDNGNTGGPALSDSKSILVNVLAVNQAPVISLPSQVAVNEDSSLPITGISITDADVGTGTLTVSLAVANGVISLGSAAGVTIATGSGNRDKNLVFSGSLGAINTALASLVYQGDKDFNGTDRITIDVSDNGNTGNGVALSDTKVLAINVAPVNDAPFIVAPTRVSANENADLRIRGLSVSDVDLGLDTLTVSLTVTNGVLSLGSTQGISFLSGDGSQDSTLIVSGSLEAINTALDSLIYRGNTNFNGSDTISVTVSDNGGGGSGLPLSNTQTIAVDILAVNAAPTITLPPTPEVTLFTDTPITGISVGDPDAGTNPLSMTVVAANGVLSLASTTGITFTQGSGNQSSRLTFTGTLAAINNALNGLIYRSNPTFTGFERISFTVNDNGSTGIGVALSDSRTLFVNVGGAINQAPIAVDDSFNGTEDTQLQGNVLSNDSDPDNTVPLTAQLLTAPTNAANFSLNFDGAFTYTPTANFNGSDTFTYLVRDAIGGISNTATVRLAVASVNDLPIATNDTYSTAEDTALTGVSVLGNDRDPDNNLPLTAVLVGSPTNAANFTFNADGTFTYTPAANFSGIDRFTYVARDSLGGGSNTATVIINVGAVNDAPIAINDSFPLDEDTTLTTGNVLSNDTDPDNNLPLTANVITGPTNAANFVFNSNGTFVYLPTANFNGSDSFTYVVRDSLGAVSNTATVSLTINAVNDPPTAVGDAFTLAEDGTLTSSTSILANDTDVEGHLPLTAVLSTAPTNGSLTLNPNGTFTYVPNANFSGVDRFTYIARDSLGAASTPATVILTVTGSGDAPIAVNDAFQVLEDGTLGSGTVLSNDTDPDNDGGILTAQLVSTTSNGTLTFNADGTFVYTPTPNFNGSDRFTYVVRDAQGNLSNTATASITVTPVNDIPVAVNDGPLAVTTNSSLSVPSRGVLLNDTDVENDPLTASLFVNAVNGDVVLNPDGSFVYTPDANFSGLDTFTYRVSDGRDISNVATVTLTVGAPNTPPIAVTDSLTLDEDTTFTTGNVLTNDSDPDNNTPLTARLVAGPSNAASFSLSSNGAVAYVPTANFNGTDTFTYQAVDSRGGVSGIATATLTVRPVADAPTVQNDSYPVVGNTSVAIAAPGVLANDTDVDGTPITAVIVSQPGQGVVTLSSNGSFVYTPNIGFVGNDTFTYRATDGALSSTATVTLVVSPGNQLPVAQNDSGYSVAEDGTLTATASVLANDSDPDNNTPLTATLATAPTNGSLTLNPTGTFTYVPNANFNGTDTFTYRAIDSLGGQSSLATVTISVTPVADAPTAVNDLYFITGTSLSVTAPGVLSNDTDVDGGPITATLATNPSRGTLTFSTDGSFLYTPNVGVTQGTDQFTYIVGDGSLTSSTATVTLQFNTAPIANDDLDYSSAQNTALTIDVGQGVLANDSDLEGSTLTASVVTLPTNGTVTLNANGSFVYTPTTGFTGTDRFIYQASDGTASSNLATASITVTANVNVAPVANNDDYTVLAGIPRTIAVNQGVLNNDTDANSDPLTATTVTGPARGQLTLSPNGSFVYTPNAGFTGSDVFTYRVSDGTATSNTATVSLTVVTNTPPVVANDTYRVAVNGTLSQDELQGVLLNDTDAETVDTLTAVLVQSTANGSLTLNPDGSFVYRPTANFQGVDTFTYRANDGVVASTATATVTLSVTNNTPPIGVTETYSAVSGLPLTVGDVTGILLNDTDPDGQDLTATIVSQPTRGTLSNVDTLAGSFVYTPNTGFTGVDTFVYRASDGQDLSSPTTVTISVIPNTAPVAVSDSYAVVTNGTLNATRSVLANDTDAEGTPLRAQLNSQPTNGQVVLNADGTFQYTPNANFVGTDRFTYQAFDGVLSSAVATVTIAVGANTAPVAQADTYSVNRNNLLSVSLGNSVLNNDTDAEGDAKTAVVVTNPTNGSLTFNPDGTFVYTPTANFAGVDRFTYRATDGSLSSTATVTLSVLSTSTPPVLQGDSYTVRTGNVLTVSTASGVLSNDSDPDGDRLVATTVTGPTSGTVTLNSDGSFVYTPNAGVTGVDTFTYRATDGINTATATVSLNVTAGINQAPVVTLPGAQVTFQNTNLTIASGISVSDADAGSNPVSVTLTASNGILTLGSTAGITPTGNGTGQVVFTAPLSTVNTVLTNLQYAPNADFAGTDNVVITVNDGGASGTGGPQSGTGTITVNVSAGATLVQDINQNPTTGTGTADATPTNLQAVNTSLYFAADDGLTGVELWRSDATSSGTQRVADLNLNGSSSPRSLTIVGTNLYFVADNGASGFELWRLDLSNAASTPTLVRDIRSGPLASNPSTLVNLNGTLFFRANDGTGLALWKSDGTSAGTVKVGTGYSSPASPTVVGSTLYFTAANGAELWRSNGTDAGTVRVSTIGSSAAMSNLTAIGSTLYFTATDATNGTELWQSDGTAGGTRRISDINTGTGSSNPSGLVSYNNALYFFASNGTNFGLYRASGGTTTLVQTITGASQAPTTPTVVGSSLFFSVNVGGDTQLWRYNGTTASLVRNLNTTGDDGVSSLVNLNGTLYFTANDGTGSRVWRTDGTSAGTVVASSAYASGPINLTVVDQRLFFTANNGVNGNELWAL